MRSMSLVGHVMYHRPNHWSSTHDNLTFTLCRWTNWIIFNYLRKSCFCWSQHTAVIHQRRMKFFIGWWWCLLFQKQVRNNNILSSPIVTQKPNEKKGGKRIRWLRLKRTPGKGQHAIVVVLYFLRTSVHHCSRWQRYCDLFNSHTTTTPHNSQLVYLVPRNSRPPCRYKLLTRRLSLRRALMWKSVQSARYRFIPRRRLSYQPLSHDARPLHRHCETFKVRHFHDNKASCLADIDRLARFIFATLHHSSKVRHLS